MIKVTKKIFKTDAEASLYTDFHRKMGHTAIVKTTAKRISVTVVR